MLVQLRRVVYLLVLLQCCVCMVRAERGTAGNGDPAPKVNELNAGTNEADEMLLKAKACISVWKNEVESYKNHVSPVKDATDEMNKVFGEIKKMLGHEGSDENGIVTQIPNETDNVKVAPLVEKATKAIHETNNAANKAKESITKIRNAEQFCESFIDKVNQMKDNLEGKEKLEEKKKLEEEDKQKIKELTNQIDASVTAMEKAQMTFEIISSALRSRIEIEEKKEAGKNATLINTFTTTKASIEKVIQALGEELTKLRETKQSVKTLEKEVELVKKDVLVKKLEEEVQRLKAEKQSEIQQERKEKEQTRMEEGKNPSEEKGEKGTKEQGAQANGGSKEKPQRGAEKETNTPAETNVQTTEAPVKEEGEKGETTGDSTQKPGESLNDASSGTVSNISLQPIISGTSDSSNSPALVHGPLLLLLLCVLGSILVC